MWELLPVIVLQEPFTRRAPLLSNCTYLGVDSGSHPIGFSLFMDVLAALGR